VVPALLEQVGAADGEGERGVIASITIHNWTIYVAYVSGPVNVTGPIEGSDRMGLVFDVGGESVAIEPEAVVIAGFTGRDREAVEAHLDELRDLGVPTPDSVPCFYLAPGSAAVQSDRLVTVGSETSGEAEVVLVFDGDDVLLTLGSDHTDRAAEAVDIALSKRVCPKILARDAWPFAAVEDRLDRLVLTSWIDHETETAYQHGLLGELMDLRELSDTVPYSARPDRVVLFTGTLAAIGGIRPSTRFRARLDDPEAERSIELDYRIDVLDVLHTDGGR